MMLHGRSLSPLRVALLRTRRRPIWASALPYSRVCKYPLSNSGGAASMTWLTWTRGLRTINSEGGPERRLFNGP